MSKLNKTRSQIFLIFLNQEKYEGWYFTSDETFLSEKDLVKGPDGKFVNQKFYILLLFLF